MNENVQFHPVQSNTDGVFNTVTGTLINIHEPTESSIKILDIANALSMLCRFGGHVRRFYSVAQHSVLVMALAPEELKKEALLHDAAEAFVGDVIKPLKNLVGEPYDIIEFRFSQVIYQKFGLDRHKLEAIKKYDLMALQLEHKALQVGNATDLVTAMNRTDMMIGQDCYWTPFVAKCKFLEEFNRLFPNQAIDTAILWS